MTLALIILVGLAIWSVVMAFVLGALMAASDADDAAAEMWAEQTGER